MIISALRVLCNLLRSMAKSWAWKNAILHLEWIEIFRWWSLLAKNGKLLQADQPLNQLY